VSGAAQLGALLREEGGLLARALAEAPADDPLLGTPAPHRALVLAAVREGYRLHYGEGEVVRTDDADLALLGGDRLYALGLARVAAEGDLDAVAQLADLISRCAQAHAEGDPSAAESAWRSTALILGR
jgi:hypothetical protein